MLGAIESTKIVCEVAGGSPWALVFSAISVVVAVTSAWLTLWRSGKLRMTRPTFIAFVDDEETSDGPKVFLRSLLFSSAKKGHVVNTMYVRLRRGETSQTFNVWTHGERGENSRGSGLFVGPEGVALNHHFCLPKDGSTYPFLAGEYALDVFATLVGSDQPVRLDTIKLLLTPAHSEATKSGRSAVYFDWGADQAAYHAHVEVRPPSNSSIARAWGPREAIKIEVVSTDQIAVTLEDHETRADFFIRVLNCSPSPVRVSSITYTVTVMMKDGAELTRSRDLADEFQLLESAKDQQHRLQVALLPIATTSGQEVARIEVRGEFMAVGEWDGAKKAGFSSFMRALVSDRRTPAGRSRD